MLTQAEENYLKAIYSLSKNSKTPVLTSSVADYIKSKPSSVTDMVQRLSDKKLVDYIKYKGVSLTKSGKKQALLIIRKHRLWELFLVKHLNFSWDKVHDIAEQLEHVKSVQLVEKLDEFLNYPTRDPHGDIIPDKNGNLREDHTNLLSETKEGVTSFIVAVKDSSEEFLNYLDNNKIALNYEIKVLTKHSYDGSISVLLNGKTKTTFSKKVCDNLFVSLNKKHE